MKKHGRKAKRGSIVGNTQQLHINVTYIKNDKYNEINKKTSNIKYIFVTYIKNLSLIKIFILSPSRRTPHRHIAGAAKKTV